MSSIRLASLGLQQIEAHVLTELDRHGPTQIATLHRRKSEFGWKTGAAGERRACRLVCTGGVARSLAYIR
jgi:hypothetical protein